MMDDRSHLNPVVRFVIRMYVCLRVCGGGGVADLTANFTGLGCFDDAHVTQQDSKQLQLLACSFTHGALLTFRHRMIRKTELQLAAARRVAAGRTCPPATNNTPQLDPNQPDVSGLDQQQHQHQHQYHQQQPSVVLESEMASEGARMNPVYRCEVNIGAAGGCVTTHT